ncbi:hypothetical protein PAXINDRAFT_19626 [Paxillus involutus ATCC 200175]|uniref:Uncharacterized protein n=1 Tax=Paxillus involutus ATCC 200175 TaxID=664439 RepID=A0A0C9T7P9_PAXIN|nr:hypothetical protein PAXINDRAFT_19626 [Paxillus involutus ATCC 200175]
MLGHVAQPACPTVVKAGPSTRARAVSTSEEGEEEIVVMRAPPKTGKGKCKSRAITLNEQEADEVMKIVMGFEVQVRDTQARLVELESDILSLRGLLEGHHGQ